MFGRKKTDPDQEFFDEDEEFDEDESGVLIYPENPEDENPDLPEREYGEDVYEEDLPDDDLYDEEDDYVEKPKRRTIFKPDRQKPYFVVSVLVNTFRVLLVVVLLLGVAAAGTLAGIAKGYVDTAPELDLIAIDSMQQTTKFMDRDRKELTTYRGTENRVVIQLSAIPKRLQNAFIAVEDARFYSHKGIDLKRIVGAFVSNLSSSGTQGGSTITQQLIKNTLLSPEQSYKRKIQEAYLAMQLEVKCSKEQILGTYLNTIYLGEDYYGVQTAAKGYFNKDLKDLTLRECAMLAGITNNPYYYNPRRNFYTRKSDEKDFAAVTNDRTDYVLRCMRDNLYITQEEYEAAISEETKAATIAAVTPTDQNAASGMYKYPHYIEHAVKECVQILLKINNLPNTDTNRAAMEYKLRTGGYTIQLAINPVYQETIEDTLQNWTKYPQLRNPSDKVYRSKNADGTFTEIIQPQAACAVLDYRTGELLAIVGSRTKVTARKTLNRATDMKMPVGSAIKPIAVYAPALNEGASPGSVAYNMPLPISGWKDAKGRNSWPTNYGGAGYTGPETLKTAMTNSHNTAAAQTLMTRVGVEKSVEYLHLMGIDDAHIDATPFGLSLGSSGITPLQMTVAFGVLANGGVYQTPISVLGISDANGDVVWDGHQHQERRRVFNQSTSFMIVDMLKAVVNNKGGTGSSAKITGQEVGGKTGTNSDQKGVFFAGVTGYYSSALWIGHDNYKALASKSTGSGAAAPLWQAYMSKIHAGLSENKKILEGDASDYGVVKVETCVVSGQLATDACRQDTKYGTANEYWAQGTQPTQYCQVHSIQTVCIESGMLASPSCPYHEQKSVVILPQGHALFGYTGTEYQRVVEEYLGTTALGNGQVCTWHSGGYQTPQTNYNPNGQNDNLPTRQYEDARALIAEAQRLLLQWDPSSGQYLAVVNAAMELQRLIDSGAGEAEVMAAMTTLTYAMGGIY